MQPIIARWTKWSILCWVLLFTCAGTASAQLIEELRIGQKASGEVTAARSYVRFAIGVNGSQTLDIQINAEASELIPWVRVLDGTSTEIARVANPETVQTFEAVVPLPEASLYFIEVGGMNDTTGAFTILVGFGPSVPGATVLRAGDTVDGLVSGETPELVYDVNSSVEGDLLVLVRGTARNAGPEVELRNEIVDQTVGTGGTLLAGVGFLVRQGDSSYSLRVRYSGSASEEPFTVCVTLAQEADACFTDLEADDPA